MTRSITSGSGTSSSLVIGEPFSVGRRPLSIGRSSTSPGNLLVHAESVNWMRKSHNGKLKNAESDLDRAPPKSFAFIDMRLSKNFHHHQRLAEITAQNAKLLGSLESIHTRHNASLPRSDATNSSSSHSGGLQPRQYKKLMAQQKIHQENRALVKRMQRLKSSYPKAGYQEELRKHKKILKLRRTNHCIGHLTGSSFQRWEGGNPAEDGFSYSYASASELENSVDGGGSISTINGEQATPAALRKILIDQHSITSSNPASVVVPHRSTQPQSQPQQQQPPQQREIRRSVVDVGERGPQNSDISDAGRQSMRKYSRSSKSSVGANKGRPSLRSAKSLCEDNDGVDPAGSFASTGLMATLRNTGTAVLKGPPRILAQGTKPLERSDGDVWICPVYIKRSSPFDGMIDVHVSHDSRDICRRTLTYEKALAILEGTASSGTIEQVQPATPSPRSVGIALDTGENDRSLPGDDVLLDLGRRLLLRLVIRKDQHGVKVFFGEGDITSKKEKLANAAAKVEATKLEREANIRRTVLCPVVDVHGSPIYTGNNQREKQMALQCDVELCLKWSAHGDRVTVYAGGNEKTSFSVKAPSLAMADATAAGAFANKVLSSVCVTFENDDPSKAVTSVRLCAL